MPSPTDWTAGARSADAAAPLIRSAMRLFVYDAVNLHGTSARERREMLIGIAHPDCRAALARGARRPAAP